MLSEDKRPAWFIYPPEYLRVVALRMTNLEPWFFLQGEDLEWRMKSLKERYPDVELVPFARRGDNDDVACWEQGGGNLKVYVIHDFSSWGWKNRREYQDFWEWYRQAIEDMIEHGIPYR